MWSVWILVAMISIAGYVAVGNEIRHPLEAGSSESADLAWSMGVYRGAVLAYARANPGFTGVVPDTALALPTWYRRDARWKNTVEGGRVIVWASGRVSADLVSELVALSNDSLLVGTADAASGRLVSVLRGLTEVPLPAAVPHGAPVWVGWAS